MPLYQKWIDQQAENSKDIIELNNNISKLDIIYIYQLLYPIVAEYTLFSSSHGLFAKIDHTQGQKIHLSKFKRTGLIQCLLLDSNGIKLESNS